MMVQTHMMSKIQAEVRQSRNLDPRGASKLDDYSPMTSDITIQVYARHGWSGTCLGTLKRAFTF